MWLTFVLIQIRCMNRTSNLLSHNNCVHPLLLVWLGQDCLRFINVVAWIAQCECVCVVTAYSQGISNEKKSVQQPECFPVLPFPGRAAAFASRLTKFWNMIWFLTSDQFYILSYLFHPIFEKSTAAYYIFFFYLRRRMTLLLWRIKSINLFYQIINQSTRCL